MHFSPHIYHCYPLLSDRVGNFFSLWSNTLGNLDQFYFLPIWKETILLSNVKYLISRPVTVFILGFPSTITPEISFTSLPPLHYFPSPGLDPLFPDIQYPLLWRSTYSIAFWLGVPEYIFILSLSIKNGFIEHGIFQASFSLEV